MATQATDKTDKSPCVSFVSSRSGGINEIFAGRAPVPSPGQVAEMGLAEFADAGLVVQVHAGVLDCELLFVSDDVPPEAVPDLGIAVYRASELKKILPWRPDAADLGTVHVVKDVFRTYGAEIDEIRAAESRK